MALDKWEKAHWRRIGKYQRELEELYDKILKEVAKMGASIKPFFKANKALNIEDYPQAARQLQKILDELNSGVTATIQNGIELEWDYSNRKNDEVLRELFGERFEKLTKDQKRRYFSTNGKALDAFIKRKDNNGLGLSDKVWRYTGQFKEEVEMALDLGIRDGVPASQMAKELKKYLQNPDKLFRRVRDEHGNLQLSKNAKAYHPGRGVYRSSYKNAMRVAITETNMAYRSADHERWKRLDFVAGVEVKLSNNHTVNGIPFTDMCDELKGVYPKSFKFVGWHPMCRCFAVPVFNQSFDEFLDDKIEELKTGKKVVRDKKEVNDLPKGFKEYIAKNKDRIERSRERGKLPYFIRDNFEVGNGGVLKPFDTNPSVLELAKQRQARRTTADVADIKHRWNERRAIRKYGNSILSYMAGISDVDTSLLNSALMGGDLAKIEVEARKLKDVGKTILALDKLGNPMQVAKQFSMSEAMTVNDSVTAKLMKWNHLSIEEQIKKLKYEIEWVEENKKYHTWKVAQDAYKKELVRVETAKKWVDNTTLLDNIKGFKTKSPIFKDALDKATEALKNKDATEFEKWFKVADNKRNELVKKSIGKPPNIDAISDKEMYAMFESFLKEESKVIPDEKLRGITASQWGRYSREERYVLTKYTQTYCYLNEPLRGIPYYGSIIPNKDHLNDLPILTNALAKVTTRNNMVVRRGVDDFPIKSLNYSSLSKLKVGDKFVEKGFLSTAVQKDSGFKDTYEFIIAVPKGAQGVYAEPFSHFTDYHKFSYATGNLWDGASKEILGGEMEWIGQRGAEFEVVKIDGKRIYMKLIGQLK